MNNDSLAAPLFSDNPTVRVYERLHYASGLLSFRIEPEALTRHGLVLELPPVRVDDEIIVLPPIRFELHQEWRLEPFNC